MTIWMDITHSLVKYSGGVVGIVRAELMLAKMLHKIDKNIKFSVMVEDGFEEVDPAEINWLWKSENISEDYSKYQSNKNKLSKSCAYKLRSHMRKLEYKKNRRKLPNDLKYRAFPNPYKNGDTIYSCGWLYPEKEEKFEMLKTFYPDIKLVYTIYDLAMLTDDLKIYYASSNSAFIKYLEWISKNCSAIVYGGKTSKIDAEKFFRLRDYRVVKGYPNKWGDDIKKIKVNPENDAVVLTRMKVKKPFVLSVGTIDFKKNYRVLYQAYCMLALKNPQKVPDLVIVGRRLKKDNLNRLYEALKKNPLVKDKIKIVNCSDEELDTLYRNCEFTVLPTLYEGWSLTLPESLRYNKFCLCSDVAPLREIGDGLAEFINPHHPKDWADKIEYYSEHTEELKKAEDKIKQNWKPISWYQSAETLHKYLTEISAPDYSPEPEEEVISEDVVAVSSNEAPCVYYNYSYIDNELLAGIPRAQIIIGRELYKLRNNIKFYAIKDGYYCDIQSDKLKNVLSGGNIDECRNEDTWDMFFDKKEHFPFKKGDVVISLGYGSENYYKNLLRAKKTNEFKYISTMYDMTPMKVPFTFKKETVDHFNRILNFLYEVSDTILYGGANTQKDSDEYQKSVGLTPVKSCVLKWGSDIVSKELTPERKQKVFEKYKIKNDFVMIVGTLQPRKNHELLLEAWHEMLNTRCAGEKIPQLVICGAEGWKFKHIVQILEEDKRLKDRVIWITPTDDELDVLYQTCKFTLLPSLYEGWSLTLPESLNYGKFCLASDIPSLTEIGEDIIDYANPYDPEEWARKIKYYYNNQDALSQKESLIKEKWTNPTWAECAQKINGVIDEIMQKEEVLV